MGLIILENLPVRKDIPQKFFHILRESGWTGKYPEIYASICRNPGRSPGARYNFPAFRKAGNGGRFAYLDSAPISYRWQSETATGEVLSSLQNCGFRCRFTNHPSDVQPPTLSLF